MKQTILAILLLGSLVGGATVFGVYRGSSSNSNVDATARLQLAERLLASEPTRSLQVLDELAASGVREGEAARLLRIQALDRSQDFQGAMQAAEAFLKDFPRSESLDKVELIRISNSLALGGAGSSTSIREAERVAASNPARPESARIQVSLAREDLRRGDVSAATGRLNTLMQTNRMDDLEILSLAEEIGRANLQRLFSPEPKPDDVVHEVRSGESINVIARRHGVTDELLMRVNNITDPRRLRVGQRLRVPKVDFTLHVSRTWNTMELRNHGQFFKVYRVRTGREEGATPVGTFRVLNKKREPTWRPGNGDVYGPGDPNNELGTRWMAFQGDILGIHGTLHPSTIGHYASNGCVGMLTEDVEELFDLITTGTTLVIQGERDLQRHRVIPAAPLAPPRQLASNR